MVVEVDPKVNETHTRVRADKIWKGTDGDG